MLENGAPETGNSTPKNMLLLCRFFLEFILDVLRCLFRPCNCVLISISNALFADSLEDFSDMELLLNWEWNNCILEPLILLRLDLLIKF